MVCYFVFRCINERNVVYIPATRLSKQGNFSVLIKNYRNRFFLFAFKTIFFGSLGCRNRVLSPSCYLLLLQEALRALADGLAVVVFPEGTRSVTGRLQPFKNGFFRLAAENPDIHILPIGEWPAGLYFRVMMAEA